ncbi:MAG: hypothetical protein MUF59_04160, partial [Candidatus Krumholzibacteria bacterium]|nr:hypothetical protein [Candidatus Krumholzibacteria bacterium]
VHIARKQYLDGSIPTGFQRTTILGVDGSIPYGDRRIGIIQLGLEEDACREISDAGHFRTYRTDRLGIPLIETVTMPEMRTPQEVADVAEILRWLVRSTGKVRTGIGATRQDVNVSVTGGQRVEIKGVPRIPDIPLLVHNEALRQVALLRIKKELASRGVDHSTFKFEAHDVTDVLKGTQYYPVAKPLKKGLEVRAVVLRGYRGILSTRTQPETTFSKEISDRVRVIACLDRLPNIAHSDMEGETFSSAEWTRMKKICAMGDNDAIVVVWGEPGDLATAVKEIAIRAEEAIDGVCNETRQALDDGTNGFERILPGPNRMYPDTDLPPIAITTEHIERIAAGLPEKPWERRNRYIEAGLREDLARRMSVSPMRFVFDRLVIKTPFTPISLAVFLLDILRRMRKKEEFPGYSEEAMEKAVIAAGAAGLIVEALPHLMKRVFSVKSAPVDEAVRALEPVPAGELRVTIGTFITGLEPPDIDREKLARHLARAVMEKFGGLAPGRNIIRMIEDCVKA